ncbi:MAG: VWA domain-containing protein, partial [Deltaproteobacteria bacterium]|nr:VWA domain-containing protein [Deltaproteobacteria bacterium]
VKTSLPQHSFLPVSGDVVEYLLAEWPKLMRPSAAVLVLDASGSMEGAPISEAKDFFRKVLARTSDRDLRALVSFNTQPRVESRFSTDLPAISAQIDPIEAVGGSAVYDGLRAAIDVTTVPEANSYRRTIVMITDGDDKNSETSLQMIQDTVSDKFARYDIKLVLIALTRPGADYTDLKKIVRSANGIYREGSFDQLNAIFDDVVKNL